MHFRTAPRTSAHSARRQHPAPLADRCQASPAATVRDPMRRLLPAALMAACLLAGCGGSKKPTSDAAPTDARAFAIAHTACQQFNDADVARNDEPQRMTDQQADLVFANLATPIKDAAARDPKAWSKLRTVTLELRKELTAGGSSDDQIENTITKVADACQKARKPPASMSTVPASTTTTSPEPTSSTSTTA